MEHLQNNFEDKFTFAVMSKPSYYHFYRIEAGEKRFVAKVFGQDKTQHHERELELLEGIDHPNILKPISVDPSLLAKLKDTFKGEIILFSEAERGDMHNYVRMLRGLPQNVAKFYLKQIVNAVLYVQKKTGNTHPNLNLQNLLVESNNNLLICGWCNSKGIKRQFLFSLAEMAVSLTLGCTPFISQNIKFDPFGKFLKEDKIAKFWQLIEKSHQKMHKGFVFSDQFKDIVGAIFLNKLTDLEKLNSVYLGQEAISITEVQQILNQRTEKIEQLKKQKKKKEKAVQKQEQIVAQEEESGELPMCKQPSRSNQIFYEQFTALKDEEFSIPPKNPHDLREFFLLFDPDCRVILAHIRNKINQVHQQQSQDYFIHPLLVLKKNPFYASLENNELKISLPLKWHPDLQQDGGQTSIEVTLGIFRQKEKLFATFIETQNSDLSPICLQWVVSWLKETLSPA